MPLGFFLLLLFTAFPDAVAETLRHSSKNKTSIEIYENIRGNPVSGPAKCSFEAVLKYLNMTNNSEIYTLSRPVKNHNHSSWIFLEVKVYAILDVRETDQSFISYIWIYLRWDNEHIWWNPEDFCGLDHILVPTQLLWIPDLTIEEMTEQDKASPSPYLNIRSHGWVEYRNDQVVISTCRMQVYRFPFDIQSCNISFKSIMHPDEEIMLYYNTNDTEVTEWSREAMQMQSEWLFISMTVTNKTVSHFGFNQTMIIYTKNMKRRSVLYIANFLLPVFFFLCLDFGSLLMSDTSGEKVAFKITILLSVTVMQLILNDILPCSSDRIPLTVAYCIGIFTLMLISLLKTILVIYLTDKDAQQDNETQYNQEEKLKIVQSCFTGLKKQSHVESVKKLSFDEMPSLNKQESTTKHMEVPLAMEDISDELRESKKKINLLCNGHEDKKPYYWTRVAQKINNVFVFIYILSAILFLSTIAIMWYPASGEI
ncbi:5-hydroxytryptamine receptor 3A-like [Cyprinodon tularosa]|uniref:5-hydroxytryptamine receptor 3A-like n=1 Tax=Cyprinodon tularosa TaxID=77115 RepID=UPI0018E1E7BC|nr:5-hydroxytryptamine receptor 3A-like [Cyprinodon tularosa]